MLSRAADSFYWMSRYLERAEHSARVIDVHLGLTLDDPTDLVGRSLLAAMGEPPTGAEPMVQAIDGAATGRVNPHRSAAVAACVVAARENARQIREQISAEMWEQLNRLYLVVRDAERAEWVIDPGTFFRSVIDGAHLFNGVTEATMSRGEGWHYMQLGRHMERATSTASMLAAYFAEPTASDPAGEPPSADDAVGLLRACAAFEAYCRFYTAEFSPSRLAEFLLLNAEFPRSVRYAVECLEESLRAIAGALGRPPGGRTERYAGQLRAALNYGQIDEIMADSLLQYLHQIERKCDSVHAALYETYITYPIESAIPR